MIDDITYGRTPDVTHRWTKAVVKPIALPDGDHTPVLVSAMQTFNGSDTAAVRLRSLSRLSFEAKIEEERSADPEVRHVPETVGHIAFASGWIRNSDHAPIGYATHMEARQPDPDTWLPVPIPTFFSVNDSVVFAQVTSFNGPQPVHPRLSRNDPTSGSPGFYLKLEEWPNYDAKHVREGVAIVVLKKGYHRLALPEDPHLMVGEVTGTDEGWREVDLGNTIGSGRPVLVTQCQTYNGSNPVVTRQRETAALAAELRLQEAESQGRHPNKEVVGYVAMGVPLY